MDYGLSSSDWDRFWQWLEIFVIAVRKVKELRRFFAEDYVDLEEYGDVDDQLSSWSLSGVQFDKNTDEKGQIYVKVYYDSGGGEYQVTLYKDAAMNNAVAYGATNSTPGTVTLSEQNDSGLSGSVYLDYSADTTDVYLKVKPSASRMLAWLGEHRWDKEVELQKQSQDTFSSAAATLGTLRDTLAALLDQFLYCWADVVQSPESMLNDYTVDSDAAEADFDGIAGDLADAMSDDSESFGQVSFSITTTADADNQGQGTVSAEMYHFQEDEAEIHLECTDETIGSETFSVSRVLSDGTREDSSYSLTMHQTFVDPAIGVKSLSITRTITDENDAGNHFQDWSVSGETSDNTDNGDLYCKWTESTKKLEIFKDAGRTQKVAEGTGEGSFPMTITCTGNAGLTVQVTVASDPGADNDELIVHLNCFKTGDRFRLSVSRTSDEDYFSSIFAARFQTEFPTSASPTVDPDKSRRA